MGSRAMPTFCPHGHCVDMGDFGCPNDTMMVESCPECERELLPHALTALIEHYGLKAVYEEVKRRPGFCGNCGTPLEDDQPHSPGGLGYCYLPRAD